MFMVVCMIVGLDTVVVRMAFLSVRVLVTMAVRVTTWAMAVSYVVEEDKTDYVRGKTERTDDENQLRL